MEEKMKLTSKEFEHNGKIPSKFTCDGENINPSLQISDIPSGTKSLALIMDDPDVPKNLREDGMWDHWIVFNVPPETDRIEEGQEPSGVHGKGTAGNLKYYGPCPPDREHRYFFKLFALDTELGLAEGVSKADVEKEMTGHILGQTELIGLYERK